MINFDDYANENNTEHNQKWPYIPDHPYRILIISGSGSGKTNALLNLINNQPDIIKAHTITINLKYQLEPGIISLNYQMDRILYQIFKIILITF